MNGPNAVLIWCLADVLKQNIEGSKLIRAFSTSKSELWLEFEKLAIGLNFYRGQGWIFLSDSEHLPLKNRLLLFQELHGLELLSVEQIPEERAFKLCFKDFILEFRLFGNKSVVYLFRQTTCVRAFPAHYEGKGDVIPSSKVISSEAVSFEQWKQRSPYLLPFMSADAALLPEGGSSLQWFLSLAARICSSKLWMCESEDYQITLESVQNSRAKSCTQGSWAELSAKFTRRFIAFAEARSLYSAEWNRLKRQESALLKHIGDRRKALELSSNVSFRMQADNIMAYMHELHRGMEACTVMDIYSGNELSIPLKKELNPQENAERLYRKAKKEHIRQEHLLSQLADDQAKLLICRNALKELSPASYVNHKLRSVPGKALEQPKKFFYFQHGGFDILVGKNASGNEQLLQEAHKNDWWLHARNGRGAHVIIRCGNRYDQVSERVKEHAASIAAWNSELKNSALVPVILTQRKYVRKAKGLASGAVIVTREKVLLVPPFNPTEDPKN